MTRACMQHPGVAHLHRQLGEQNVYSVAPLLRPLRPAPALKQRAEGGSHRRLLLCRLQCRQQRSQQGRQGYANPRVLIWILQRVHQAEFQQPL